PCRSHHSTRTRSTPRSLRSAITLSCTRSILPATFALDAIASAGRLVVYTSYHSRPRHRDRVPSAKRTRPVPTVAVATGVGRSPSVWTQTLCWCDAACPWVLLSQDGDRALVHRAVSA